jgi:hypothetical protein
MNRKASKIVMKSMKIEKLNARKIGNGLKVRVENNLTLFFHVQTCH